MAQTRAILGHMWLNFLSVAKLGFSVAVVPKANAPKNPNSKEFEGLTIHAVERVEEAMNVVRGL